MDDILIPYEKITKKIKSFTLDSLLRSEYNGEKFCDTSMGRRMTYYGTEFSYVSVSYLHYSTGKINILYFKFGKNKIIIKLDDTPLQDFMVNFLIDKI